MIPDLLALWIPEDSGAPHGEQQAAAVPLHMAAGIVTEEMRFVARQRAGGDGDGAVRLRRGVGGHANVRARRQVAHRDDPFVKIDVARRADIIGVAGDDDATGDGQPAPVTHVHTATTTFSRISGDRAAGYRERAVFVHVHAATTTFSRIS